MRTVGGEEDGEEEEGLFFNLVGAVYRMPSSPKYVRWCFCPGILCGGATIFPFTITPGTWIERYSNIQLSDHIN